MRCRWGHSGAGTPEWLYRGYATHCYSKNEGLSSCQMFKPLFWQITLPFCSLWLLYLVFKSPFQSWLAQNKAFFYNWHNSIAFEGPAILNCFFFCALCRDSFCLSLLPLKLCWTQHAVKPDMLQRPVKFFPALVASYHKEVSAVFVTHI